MYYTYYVKDLTNNKIYIGSRTAKCMLTRDAKDDLMVRYFTSSADKSLKESIKNNTIKYGIIKEYSDTKECLLDEQELIRLFWMFYGKENSYNHSYMRFDGKKVFSTAGVSPSEETRKKISAYQKGKKVSDETRKKMSEAFKGKPKYSLRGKPLKEETKKKMSKSHKGIRPSEETRKKLSDAKKGFKPTEETKKIWSEQRKGGLHPRAKKIKNIETEQIWDCIKDCAKYYNVSSALIHYWLKKNINNLIRI